MAGTVAASAPVVHRSRGVVRIEVAMTCDASGVISESVIGEAWGRLVGVFYDGGLDASAVITLKAKPGNAVSSPVMAYTTGTEGTPVRFRPTAVIADNAGAAISAGAGATNVNRDIDLAGKLTLTVASGGVSETGKIAFVIDESVEPNLMDSALTV